MKDQIATVVPEVSFRLKRRNLLRAAAAAGGALVVTETVSAKSPRKSFPTPDPQLRSALLKYGGEFGQMGKGGIHGDL